MTLWTPPVCQRDPPWPAQDLHLHAELGYSPSLDARDGANVTRIGRMQETRPGLLNLTSHPPDVNSPPGGRQGG